MSESDPKPCVYLFHGDDLAAIDHAVNSLVRRMGDPTTAELNISRLDGRTLTDEDLRTAVMALPFLSDRRLVIVTHPLVRIEKKNIPAQERFTTLLDAVPPSTGLVLVLADSFERKRWNLLPANHWLLEWKGRAGKRAHYQLYQLPQTGAMPGWIMKKAGELGGEFTPQAAAALVELVGNETQVAQQEIAKLLDYVNRERGVTVEDVQQVAAAIGQANIFEMTDALAEGNPQKAQRVLHALLEETDAQALFSMVVRQFRLLIMVREALDDGIPHERMGQATGQNSEYVIKKLERQAARFTLAQLEQIYHRLLEIDAAAKVSAMPLETALDLLVVEV